MRQFIRSLQESRSLSLADLIVMLGYKSQTSLIRLMQDKANLKSLVHFCQLARESSTLALTRAEISQLEHIVEYKRLGHAEYAAVELLRQLLRDEPPMVDPMLENIGTGTKQTLLECYRPLDELHITVLNCESAPIFTALSVLAQEKQATIQHYLCSDGSLLRTVMAVRAALPLLHEEHYFGGLSCVQRQDVLNNPHGVMLADMMLCEYTQKGLPWYDVVIFQGKESGMRFTFPGRAEKLYPMFREIKSLAQPLRYQIPPRHRDYVTYLRHCADMEKDRPVYRIKPDLGIEQIPVPILQRAVLEGTIPDAAFLADFPQLVEIFTKRQENTFCKKQPQHHVFKQRAMWRFVRTGRLSDQFWVLRSFTMEERLSILENLLEQHLNNPYYKVYFLKDESFTRNDEIIFFEESALCIVKAGTNYDLSSHHSEIIITQPDFLRIYRSFFLHSVLPHSVHPDHKTQTILLQMIDYCRQHQ